MNEKCSLDNLSRYLRVIGLLSLIIILIIVVYYYLQSNHSSILEKYEGYSRRDCVVYLKGDIADTPKCDTTQGTSNYTDTCSYRFDGWSEFDTYTDKDGKTIPYPKKIYTLTNTNSGSFTNPMFTNNCFKPNTSEEDGIPQEFEYNANNVVRYDEQGTSGNTAVGTNIFGGSRYSTMQFLNTPNPTDNYNTLLDSICSASTKALGSLKDSMFYMFEFDGTTNKLTNVTSVALNDDQTTFSISSKYNVLTNLPPIITPLKDAYGIQYDTNAKALKIFKKNNIEKEVLVYKFNYMSYVCPQSQIKNYMRARRMITPDKFIKYGTSATPYYSKIISVGNMNINKDWDWNYYKSDDMNFDYSVALKTDLSTAINSRERDIKISYKPREDIAEKEYKDADAAFKAASTSRDNLSTDFPTFSELIGITKKDNTRVFDYISGYNTSSIDNLNISIPQGATATKVGTDICITFPYTGSFQTKDYVFTIPKSLNCDILVVGGGGAGGTRFAGGGGAGTLIYVTNQTLTSGTYTIKVGRGGIGIIYNTSTAKAGEAGKDSEIFNSGGSVIYRAKGGGGGDVNANAATTSTSSVQGGSSGGSSPNFNNGANSYLSSGMSPVATNVLTINGSTTTITPNNTSVYGYAGGGGSIFNNRYLAGGGGGAGGIGQSINASGFTNAGNGGSAFACSITGSSVAYAGGGGAGGGRIASTPINEPGSGGSINGTRVGGNGGYLKAATTFNGISYPAEGVGGDGVANTGSGGGGSGTDDPAQAGSAFKGGSGGSGVVIIRYSKTMSSSSIHLVSGSVGDSNHDYKIGNYGGEFKIISSVNNNDADYIRITSSGAIFNPTGTSSWTTTSDKRIKDNIEEASYDKCYDNINSLGLYRFNYLTGFNNVNKDTKQLGFIAQEVREIFPKAISSYNFNNNYINIPDLLSIDITQINYSLYGAVKKLIMMNEEKDICIKKIQSDLNIILSTITSNVSVDNIYTSNVCATQELHQQIEAQDVRIKELETKIDVLLNS